jgi:glycopeptide antibiotics resistance protein
MILGVFCRFSIQNGRFYIGFAIDKRMWFAASKFAVYCGGKNNIIINLTMFLPFGLATAFLAKKHKLLKALIFGFLASLTIEFLQFALPINRTPELFDVAANTLSSVMGAIYCYIILFIKKFVDKIKLKSAK